MSTNTGGPAFPVGKWAEWGGSKQGEIAGGMTLRDYFAAKALQGLIANKSNPLHFKPEDDADYCYTIADAMLAAREAGNGK